MAINLQAEQKNVHKLFSENKLKYKIPPYQRPYSWGIDQCEELFQDLERVFSTNKEDGYFLGNLVLALDAAQRETHEVIDGQQRIITLTLLLKALLTYDTNNANLKSCLWQVDSRTSEVEFPRVVSLVVENDDDANLKSVINEDLPIVEINKNNLYENINYFHEQLKVLDESNEVEKFADFVLYNVSLLPILTEDSNIDKAREKALVIFETINNRGMSLTDSDIFKAKLYSIALNKSSEKDFIRKWQELDEGCKSIDIKIDDIFRVYMHVIRGEQGIRGFETSLREFYTSSNYSPIGKKSLDNIIEDLFCVFDSISFFKEIVKNTEINNELTKWFQLVDIYTNQYPYIALVVYLFKTKQVIDEQLISTAKNLVKFAYYTGSTSRIKHSIYPIIVNLMNGKEYKFKDETYSEEKFNFVGTMRKPYTLLSYYLKEEAQAIYPFYIDRILLLRDREHLSSNWEDGVLEDAIETLGNYCVSDIQRKNQILPTRLKTLSKTKLNSLNELVKQLPNWQPSDYQKRNADSVQRIADFIRN